MTSIQPAIERRTIASQVTERLRSKILSGELAIGQRLRQEQLAAELGVSRVPVREALNQLEAEGLILVEANKGAVVKGISVEALSEMYELRAHIEEWLIALAIPRASEADYESAARILDEMLSESSPVHWTSQNWKFHETLYRPSARTQSLDMLDRLYKNTYRHFPVPVRFTLGIEAMDTEHRELLALYKAKDIVAAQKYLRQHIMRGASSLVERMLAAQNTET
ncbi:GntR family transcriptional regulator [Brucella gallinifaecis]|uniref:GntR family transcriptional regulator n=1 Tax=Brucella gallinifaecis TaxID=215590 RepID=A0A502BP07_9HYPH|nr:GntR family transcriptional regulator [Brucella gallinifaecis]TPF75381.1 GntR family transcriptional regulator [Brucella gallinifaecis]